MANTSLPNLTERTTTANSDLIHVNSGGTDYKETKANFLSDVNSSITSLNNSLTNSLALKITSTAPNLSNTVYSANSVKVMSVTAPTDINQLINVTIIGDYPSGSRQNLIAVSSWLYSGNVYVAIQNITSSSITATLQVHVWYRKSD